ncbi:hypothetical protein FOA52_005869 [Chlamydomonas sp. UWO 241]|nr:hypothetical protein FOA52_005869 [Chlamydomonas sp. UWO 241]
MECSSSSGGGGGGGGGGGRRVRGGSGQRAPPHGRSGSGGAALSPSSAWCSDDAGPGQRVRVAHEALLLLRAVLLGDDADARDAALHELLDPDPDAADGVQCATARLAAVREEWGTATAAGAAQGGAGTGGGFGAAWPAGAPPRVAWPQLVLASWAHKLSPGGSGSVSSGSGSSPPQPALLGSRGASLDAVAALNTSVLNCLHRWSSRLHAARLDEGGGDSRGVSPPL